MKKRILLTSLAIFAGLFLFRVSCFAGHWETYESTVCTRDVTFTFTFEHRPGGYWIVTDDSLGRATICDWNVYPASGYAYCSGTVGTIYPLPAEVIAARRNGTVKLYVESSGQPTNVDFSYYSYSMSQSTLSVKLSLCPVISPYTLNDFVSGLNVTVPLIDSAYGHNRYTVYPAVGSAGTGIGSFYTYAPYYVETPCIHPSQIKNSSGAFYLGETINVNGSQRNGLLYTVGKNGSFKSGDAVALCFYCPVRLRFISEVSYYVEDPVVPSGGSAGGGSGQGGGNGGTEPGGSDPGNDAPGGDSVPGGNGDGPGGGNQNDGPGSNQKPEEDPPVPGFDLRLHRVR